MAMASSTGIMDPCFFVGRGELLAWINGLLNLNLSKVEEARAGRVPESRATLLDDALPPLAFSRLPAARVRCSALPNHGRHPPQHCADAEGAAAEAAATAMPAAPAL